MGDESQENKLRLVVAPAHMLLAAAAVCRHQCPSLDCLCKVEEQSWR